VQCNAGIRSTNLVGDLAGYGTVWYDPKAIANILSLKQVRKQFIVEYVGDAGDPRFIVTKPDGKTHAFRESESGLYYMDMEATKPETVLINTVADNRSNYTNADYSNAVKAHELQIKIG
jgi:hypothetical protein